jgi:hypothetical protein
MKKIVCLVTFQPFDFLLLPSCVVFQLVLRKVHGVALWNLPARKPLLASGVCVLIKTSVKLVLVAKAALMTPVLLVRKGKTAFVGPSVT